MNNTSKALAMILPLLAGGISGCGKSGNAGATLLTSKMAGGTSHICALGSDGSVQCWGSNARGQLGTGNFVTAALPAPVQSLTSGVTDLAAGLNHTCAVVNGGVQCWGYNNYGALGNGTPTTICTDSPTAGQQVTCSNTPVSVTGIASGASGVAVGTDFTCALVGSGVQCWGVNTNGQLGTGASNATANGTPAAVSGLTGGVTAIAVGYAHACAIVNGGVQCWGDNSFGQLGDGTTTERAAPVQVSGLTSGVTAIAAGYIHTCAIVNGAAQCWGTNIDGEIGDATTTLRKTPTAVSGLTSGVTALAANGNSFHTCAIVNGGAQCWGQNKFGEIGNGTAANATSPAQVQGLTSGISGVSVGQNFSCALGGGKVQCWGDNGANELMATNIQHSLVPFTLPGLSSN